MDLSWLDALEQDGIALVRFNELLAERGETVCTSPRGGAILMRPLTLHASSAAVAVGHRRVLHVEYASVRPPAPLRWALGWVAGEREGRQV